MPSERPIDADTLYILARLLVKLCTVRDGALIRQSLHLYSYWATTTSDWLPSCKFYRRWRVCPLDRRAVVHETEKRFVFCYMLVVSRRHTVP